MKLKINTSRLKELVNDFEHYYNNNDIGMLELTARLIKAYITNALELIQERKREMSG